MCLERTHSAHGDECVKKGMRGSRLSLCARMRDDAIACTSADVERLSGRRASFCERLGCGAQASGPRI